MKKLIALLTILVTGCITPRHVYIVDDVYHSRQIQRYPQYFRPTAPRPSFIELPPYRHWGWQQFRSQPQKRTPRPFTAPRKENLDSYHPQLPPPPPSSSPAPVENKEEVKKSAPVRKF